MWIYAASQPVRVNYAFVVARYDPGFLQVLREYLPLIAPILGALIGWIVATILARAGWRMTRGR